MINKIIIIISLISINKCSLNEKTSIVNSERLKKKEISNDFLSKETDTSNNTYKIGVINDPDGYTNLRKEPSSKSEIIDKIMEKEYFFFEESIEENWFKIKTLKDQKGFIHKSRIREVKNNNLFSISIQIYDNNLEIERDKDTIVNLKSLNSNINYIIKEFNYPKVKGIKVYKDSLSFYENGLKGAICKKEFAEREHDIEYEDGFIKVIDNKIPWGVDQIVPKNEMTKILVNNKEIPKEQFENFYEPNLTNTEIFKKNDDVIIFMNNGDGAGAYTIVFILRNGELLSKFAYTPF